MQKPLVYRLQTGTVQSRQLRVVILVRIRGVQTNMATSRFLKSRTAVDHVEALAWTVPEAEVVEVAVLEAVDDDGVFVVEIGLCEV